MSGLIMLVEDNEQILSGNERMLRRRGYNVITAKDDTESELGGLSLGAVDYIAKPFSVPLLLKRIELHLLMQDFTHNLQVLVDEKTEKIMGLQDAILSTVAELVEFRDGTTGGHIERTQLYLKALVEEMLAQKVYSDITSLWNIGLLVQSAQLHDVGKISIPDRILNKPGMLTAEEFEIMKDHTTLGRGRQFDPVLTDLFADIADIFFKISQGTHSIRHYPSKF